MHTLAALWEKFWNMLLIPNTAYFFKIALVTSGLYLLARWRRGFRLTLTLSSILAAPFVFGLPILLETGVVVLGASWWGRHLFRLRENFLATLSGLGVATSLYFVTVTLTNTPSFARILLLIWGLFPYLATALARRSLRALLAEGWAHLGTLTLIDWILLAVAVVFASTPQTHWDAAQANLYIAKWYVQTNSFTPLQEAISSLFPQGGNLYYTWFLTGGLRSLQLGLILPLFLCLLLIRYLIRTRHYPPFLSIIIYAALTLPIVIFQSSNGYYDLLNLTYLLAAYVLVVGAGAWIPAAIYVGLATTLKLFPAAYLPWVLGGFWLAQAKAKQRLLRTLLVAMLALAPMLGSSLRSYRETGSPIFPFFQQLFPTPVLWDHTEKLEENPMIQTPLTSRTWLMGGIFAYPVLTYLHSPAYLEAQPLYTGVIYILVLPLQLYALWLSLKQRRTQTAVIHGVAFGALYVVGIFTRYYRYLWPFQFLWLLTSLDVVRPLLARVRQHWFMWLSLVVFGLANWLSLISYYRYYPLDTTKLFHPDYYQTHPESAAGPILILNQRAKIDQRILDLSSFLLPRVQLKARVYQCNWYYQQGIARMRAPDALAPFHYLVTDVNQNQSSYCDAAVQAALAQETYHQIYQDAYYRIYEKN